MENCLNIVEVLHKEEETFVEEMLNLSAQKLALGFFLMPHMIVIWTYLSRKNQQGLGGIIII